MQNFKTIGTKLLEELRSQEVPTVDILRVKNVNFMYIAILPKLGNSSV